MCCINKKITCQIHVQFSAQCSHRLYFLYNSSLLFLFCATYTWAQNICPGLPVCSIKCLFLEGKNNRGSLKMRLCFKLGQISLLASKWQVHKVVTDRTFGSAELLLCGLAQMTELFSAEHRTFFVLHSMPMASFSSLVFR